MSDVTTLRAEIAATRRMLDTYDETIAKTLTAEREATARIREALGEIYAARGDAHELLMKLESRLRSVVAAGGDAA